MAWMRMMGAESVAYHRRTVLERGDDYPGMALAYYASRGETPLRWGGSRRRGAGPGWSGVAGSVRGDLRAGRRPPSRERGAAGGGPPAGHGTGDLGA